MDICEAFLVACKTGNITLIELTLRAGADINYAEGQGLINACANFHLDAIKYLIDNGCKIYYDSVVKSMIETIKEYDLDRDTIDMYAGYFYTAMDASINKFWEIFDLLSDHGFSLTELNKDLLLSLLKFVNNDNIHKILSDELFMFLSQSEIVDDYISNMLGFNSLLINFLIDNHIDSFSQSQLVKLATYYPCNERVNRICETLISLYNVTPDLWKDIVKQFISNGYYERFIPILENLLTYVDTFEEFPIDIHDNYSNIFYWTLNEEFLELIWQKCNISEDNLMTYYDKVNERFKKNPSYLGLKSLKEFIGSKVKELSI